MAAPRTATILTQAEHAHAHSHSKQNLLKVALGALGVVYGDIGTSPLYAIKECFSQPHGNPVVIST